MGVNFKIPRVKSGKGLMFSRLNFYNGKVHVYWLPNQLQQDVDNPLYILPSDSPFPMKFPALRNPKVVRIISETNTGNPGTLVEVRTIAFTRFVAAAECEGRSNINDPSSPFFTVPWQSLVISFSGSYTFPTAGPGASLSPIPGASFKLHTSGGSNTPITSPTDTSGTGGNQIVPGLYLTNDPDQIVADALAMIPGSDLYSCRIDASLDPDYGPTTTDKGTSMMEVGGGGTPGNVWVSGGNNLTLPKG